ncbi:hypothetical protein AB0F13_10905 [Streptomyces sp. NPDC026206]|uniref:hypothetical protein n=1 Tax=Streptomyces sp. NPDC026206 TaxID=3157089 RepID=UPI0033E08A61
MASARIALCGALTLLAAVSAVPAQAHDGPVTTSGTIELTPVTSRPGADVRLRVSGCAGARATATSEAFVADAKLAKDPAGMVAETTVRETATAGTYPVRVHCDGRDTTAAGELTVVTDGRELPDPRPAGHPGDGPGRARTERDRGDRGENGDRGDRGEYGDQDGRDPLDPHSSPVAPVPAGAGGTAPAATAEAPDTPGLVLAGTTAAIAGALIWYRRRTNAAQR